jgi:hypothetical protein
LAESDNEEEILLFNGSQLVQNDRIINPNTGTTSFGYISNLKDSQPGHILLKWGNHASYHKGFGCIHIWKQHGNEAKLKKHCSVIEDVPLLVNRILVPGTTILDTGKFRPAVVKSALGTIILECPNDYRDYYSIVTLHFNTNMKGIVIGSIGREPVSENK